MGIEIRSDLNYGQKVTDNVTGFKGVVTAITKFQHGCVRILVQPRMGKDGKRPEGEWVDEPQLTGKKSKKPHGPQQDAKRQNDPTR